MVTFEFVTGQLRALVWCVVGVACLLGAFVALHQLGVLLPLICARLYRDKWRYAQDGRFVRIRGRLWLRWDQLTQVWQWGPCLALCARDRPPQWVFADELPPAELAALARQASANLPSQPVGLNISK